MSISISLTRIPIGSMVIDARGDEVGKVVEAHPDHIVIEHGHLFHDDVEVPRDVVARVDGARVQLNLSADEIKARDWPRNGTPG